MKANGDCRGGGVKCVSDALRSSVIGMGKVWWPCGRERRESSGRVMWKQGTRLRGCMLGLVLAKLGPSGSVLVLILLLTSYFPRAWGDPTCDAFYT